MEQKFNINDKVVIKRNASSYMNFNTANKWRKRGKVLSVLSVEENSVVIGDNINKLRAPDSFIRKATFMDYVCYGITTLLRI